MKKINLDGYWMIILLLIGNFAWMGAFAKEKNRRGNAEGELRVLEERTEFYSREWRECEEVLDRVSK